VIAARGLSGGCVLCVIFKAIHLRASFISVLASAKIQVDLLLSAEQSFSRLISADCFVIEDELNQASISIALSPLSAPLATTTVLCCFSTELIRLAMPFPYPITTLLVFISPLWLTTAVL